MDSTLVHGQAEEHGEGYPGSSLPNIVGHRVSQLGNRVEEEKPVQ